MSCHMNNRSLLGRSTQEGSRRRLGPSDDRMHLAECHVPMGLVQGKAKTVIGFLLADVS